MYVNTLDTYLCMYFRAKNTPFPPEKVSLEKISSRSVRSRYNLKSREMSEMRTRQTSSETPNLPCALRAKLERHLHTPFYEVRIS
jgi:hypothetical protein